jgi:hypothetical protein
MIKAHDKHNYLVNIDRIEQPIVTDAVPIEF